MTETKDKTPAQKVGYTWYPKDWWTSETFFNTDDLIVRLLYREVIDLLNLGGGFWKADRSYLNKLQRYQISDEQWSGLSALFIRKTSENVEVWAHDSVTKRLGRTQAQQAQALANLDRINTEKRKPITGDSPKDSPEENHRSAEAHRPFKPNITEDNITKPNYKFGLEELHSDQHTPTRPLLGDRFSVKEFEDRFRTFSEAERILFSRAWDKLTDQETKDAAYFYAVELNDNQSKNKKPPRILKFIESRRWEYWQKKFAKIKSKTQQP